MGRFGLERPALLRRTALAMAVSAGPWLTTRLPISSSIFV